MCTMKILWKTLNLLTHSCFMIIWILRNMAATKQWHWGHDLNENGANCNTWALNTPFTRHTLGHSFTLQGLSDSCTARAHRGHKGDTFTLRSWSQRQRCNSLLFGLCENKAKSVAAVWIPSKPSLLGIPQTDLSSSKSGRTNFEELRIITNFESR